MDPHHARRIPRFCYLRFPAPNAISSISEGPLIRVVLTECASRLLFFVVIVSNALLGRFYHDHPALQVLMGYTLVHAERSHYIRFPATILLCTAPDWSFRLEVEPGASFVHASTLARELQGTLCYKLWVNTRKC